VKKLVFLISFFLAVNRLTAQQAFGDCILRSLTNVDSLVKDTIYNSRHWQDCVLEKQVPDIRLTTVAGKTVSMKDLRGKIVVLNFWFIECYPCIAELPALNRLVKEYKKKGVLFFGITYQSLKSLKTDFLPNYKFDFEIVHDASDITEQFSAGYPTTYIIDKNGIVKSVWSGGFTGKEAESGAYLKAKPVIDELLNK
jgi:peroxiredoxin